VVSDALVKVLTTQVSVTSSSEHLEHTVIDRKDGYIESTTTKIKNDDVLLILLVETVGNGSGRRLVDDTEDFKTRDGTSILGSLPL